jgi:phosphoenolpyruvate carboxykinase (ATP)
LVFRAPRTEVRRMSSSLEEFARVHRNSSPGELYEFAVSKEGANIVSSGALATSSGAKTGRSPKDKRIVRQRSNESDVWWGNVNVALPPASFDASRAIALEHLRRQPYVYVVDGYAGWDPRHRLAVRVICSRAYHALFMQNMLIRPSREELASFGEPDFVILNAGEAAADPAIPGVGSKTSVAIDFDRREMLILGTEYAGEMKKGIFTLMHYEMPRRGVLSMHCSANEGPKGDVSLFFGLSGTGKTTLSADPRRRLIGDDEHCWSEHGVFNIEGGCYAKCSQLSEEREPEIYRAIRFGSVLENVVFDPKTRVVDFANLSITENTRCAYPIEFIPNARIPCVGRHPDNIVFLTCDAFGVLPPVSRLSPAQAMYHFISGYTAKVAGTEMGVTEPEATFSACFGAAFLVWHPTKYAEMLAEKMHRHDSKAWLVNTGWTGGPHGVGSRIRLAHTRAIIDAIHDGSIAAAATHVDPVFGLAIPRSVAGVPSHVLDPRGTWKSPAEYDTAALRLAERFHRNFENYADVASDAVLAVAPGTR